MSIAYRLGQHHRDIESRFGDVREALSMLQGGIAVVLFQIAAKKLIACIRAQHAVVFPRFADIPELVHDVVKACQQHERIEDSINQLRIGGLPGLAWNAELERLISLLRQNVDLIELSMFPIAGLKMMPRQLTKIGIDYATFLEHSTSVAGASITYDPEPVDLLPVRSIPMIRLLDLELGDAYEVLDLSNEALDLNEDVIDLATGEVIDPELEDITYVFDSPGV